MPLIYCDHNFLVLAHDADVHYKTALTGRARSAHITFVLSPWHWLEMARDRDLLRGESMADFADSLTPRWLYDRIGVQRREVASALFRFFGVASAGPPMVVSLAEVLTDLTSTSTNITATYDDSRTFVRHMHNLGENHPLELSVRRNFECHRRNGEAYRSGELTPELLRRMDRLYIARLLPTRTPAGVILDSETKRKFLQSCRNEDFPAIAVETVVTRDGWRTGRSLNDRTFRDSQHVVALPYVDIFVSNDLALAGILARTVTSLPFATAEVITKEEFDRRFL